MRKPRAIIYDDDKTLLMLFRDFFSLRGYDVLTYPRPLFCPIYADHDDCDNLSPCADIILSDYRMPGMTGAEMLKEQSRRGCKVPVENRAITSGMLDERGGTVVRELGCTFFQKPLSFDELSAWLDVREAWMDLSRPLGMLRRERRDQSNEAVTYLLPPAERAVDAVAVNVSPSGLCLKTDVPVRPGETLTVRPGFPRPSRAASVRWVRNIGGGLFMTGLQYINGEKGPSSHPS